MNREKTQAVHRENNASNICAEARREIIDVLHGLQTDEEPPWDIWFNTVQRCIDNILQTEVPVPIQLKDAKTKIRVDHLIDALVKLRAKDRTGAGNAVQASMTE